MFVSSLGFKSGLLLFKTFPNNDFTDYTGWDYWCQVQKSSGVRINVQHSKIDTRLNGNF